MKLLRSEKGAASSGIVLLLFLVFFIVFIVLFSGLRFVAEYNEISSMMGSLGHSLALDLHYREYGDQTNAYTKRYIEETFPELDRKVDLSSIEIIVANDMNDVCARELKKLKNQNMKILIESNGGIGSSIASVTIGDSPEIYRSVYTGERSIESFISQYGGNAINVSRSSYPENYAKDAMVIIAYKLQPDVYPKLLVGGETSSEFQIDKDSTSNDMPYVFVMNRLKFPFAKND